MKTLNNTILITGGGSGIGFETAKAFSERGNRIIITGRNKNKLDEAAQKLKGVIPFIRDVTE